MGPLVGYFLCRGVEGGGGPTTISILASKQEKRHQQTRREHHEGRLGLLTGAPAEAADHSTVGCSVAQGPALHLGCAQPAGGHAHVQGEGQWPCTQSASFHSTRYCGQ